MKVISYIVNSFRVCISNGTTNVMYKVNYNSPTSYVSNYFNCDIQPEGLLYDAEHDC